MSLEESDWKWIEEDQALDQLYPHRAFQADEPGQGVVLLSKLPLVEQSGPSVVGEVEGAPRGMWATVELGEGRRLTVLASHPLPPYPFRQHCALPPCYDTGVRDASIKAIRRFVEPLLARGERVLLMGDFNVTEREPAYRDLVAGLHDAYRQAGSGNGNTWRPYFLMQYPFGLLRIDYMLTSPNVTPLGTSVDCTPMGSDHCILSGQFEIDS